MNLTPEKRYDEIILIADDNEQTSLFLETLLDEQGFSSVIAKNGKETLEIIQSQRVDLVLLDIVLPDMDGFSIAKKLKAINNDRFLPIIMVTALAGEADKINGLSSADDYITKPFSGDELIARIKSLVRNKRLHEELSLSKARFESLYENFPHLYISLDSDKKITDCNRFFRQTFNVAKSEIVGRSLFDFIIAEEHTILDHFINSLQHPVSVKQRIFRLIGPNLTDTLFVNFKAVYIGDKGTGLWSVIAMEDITKQLKIQEEKKIARKQLYKSARLASIGTLASGVAHEMNNPLTAILGFSSALIDRMTHKEEINQSELEQYLQIINMEALRCRDIVENLSRFAREGGDVIAGSVSLLDCLGNALKLVNAKLVRSNIRVDNFLQEKIQVFADANKIEQVFVNIFTNCIDFCGHDCIIKIIPAVPRDSARFYAIQIVDNGLGIPSDILPKVFDPFFTTKVVGRGTGMGLSVCHRLMEELNGSIDILSEKNKGTTVVLEFLKSNVT